MKNTATQILEAIETMTAKSGANRDMYSVRQIREAVCASASEFDAAFIALRAAGVIHAYHHDFASSLSATQRAEQLVCESFEPVAAFGETESRKVYWNAATLAS